MNLSRKKISGMILPTAAILTFSTMLLTIGYMERLLNKKINLDIRIAQAKARLNAESGVSITITGPDERFDPGIGSSKWPANYSADDEFAYDVEGFIDNETFLQEFDQRTTRRIVCRRAKLLYRKEKLG